VERDHTSSAIRSSDCSGIRDAAIRRRRAEDGRLVESVRDYRMLALAREKSSDDNPTARISPFCNEFQGAPRDARRSTADRSMLRIDYDISDIRRNEFDYATAMRIDRRCGNLSSTRGPNGSIPIISRSRKKVTSIRNGIRFVRRSAFGSYLPGNLPLSSIVRRSFRMTSVGSKRGTRV